MGEHVPVHPVLDRAGRINMMFALEQGVCVPGRRRLGQDLPAAVVAAEVEGTRAQLAALAHSTADRVEWRVGASLFHQGLANRVLSPVLAGALCQGVGLRAERMHWDPHRAGGSIVLATDQQWAAPLPEGPRGVADWVGSTVLEPHGGVLGRVEAALVGAGRIAPGLLRGNTASALAGAVRSVAIAHPGLRRAGQDLVGELLARPGLQLSGSYTGTDTAGQARFARTTCCLYYRLQGGGLCGDCALG